MSFLKKNIPKFFLKSRYIYTLGYIFSLLNFSINPFIGIFHSINQWRDTSQFMYFLYKLLSSFFLTPIWYINIFNFNVFSRYIYRHLSKIIIEIISSEPILTGPIKLFCLTNFKTASENFYIQKILFVYHHPKLLSHHHLQPQRPFYT